ncbi:hypothetical protein E2C01_075009 [Portunus trituberculatus]|uniref:Uncharacterized protein n=1 Tax=Portunus trituberculatus TaxID=210409 RepID=A0A5B7IF14_PORTR|nr:hypothetical protein [Portunus trituberculatus]
MNSARRRDCRIHSTWRQVSKRVISALCV